MRCIRPVRLLDGDNVVFVPCGKCVNCMRNKQNDWIFRLSQEQLSWQYTYFVTLTYRDNDLHFVCSLKGSHGNHAEFSCLNKRDIQLFLKRLRKNIKGKLKYIICGEYGDTTLRPHYHGLLFSDCELDRDVVLKSWNHQDIVYNCFDVAYEGAAAGYVTKYLTKSVLLPKYIQLADRQIKPFIMCSKGLGISYLENPEVFNFHKDGSETYVVRDGIKYSIPRYYREKIFTDKQKEVISAVNDLRLSEDILKHQFDYLRKGFKSKREYLINQQKEIDRIALKKLKSKVSKL